MRISDLGILELMKTDSVPGPLGRRRWRIQDLHDLSQDLHNRGFVNIEPRGELFLERSELPSQLGRPAKRLAHLNESLNDKHVDSRSPDRSPVSQTDNTVYPTASPHVVFIWTARELRRTFAQNEESDYSSIAPLIFRRCSRNV
jgi:hypothetical protein